MTACYWQTLRSELGRRVLAAQLTEDHFGPGHPGIGNDPRGDDRRDLEEHDLKAKCPDEHYGDIPAALRKRYCLRCHRLRERARKARWRARRRAA